MIYLIAYDDVHSMQQLYPNSFRVRSANEWSVSYVLGLTFVSVQLGGVGFMLVRVICNSACKLSWFCIVVVAVAFWSKVK